MILKQAHRWLVLRNAFIDAALVRHGNNDIEAEVPKSLVYIRTKGLVTCKGRLNEAKLHGKTLRKDHGRSLELHEGPPLENLMHHAAGQDKETEVHNLSSFYAEKINVNTTAWSDNSLPRHKTAQQLGNDTSHRV